MNKKILLHVENRFLKGIFLKSIASADFGILDIIDVDDLDQKLDAFGTTVCLAIYEITDRNMNAVQVELDRLKTAFADTPILAVISKDTADVVKFAMKARIRDVVLLPESKALYRKAVQEKMEPYYEKFRPYETKEKETLRSIFYKEDLENIGIRESLIFEIKRAQRGGYSLSLVMAHMILDTPEELKNLFRRVRTFLRDTDKVIIFDEETFVGIFPFAPKDNVTVIEQKFREAFTEEFGGPPNKKRLFLFSATYPDDETELTKLIDRLENGINNSMLIDSIKSPLNALTKTEIENYKQKIRQYKKFF